MKRPTWVVVLWIAVCLVLATIIVTAADWLDETVTVTGTGNVATPVTQTVSWVRGELQALHIVLDTATDVDVDINVDPALTSEDRVTLYTADNVNSDRIIRPLFDANDTDGSALTNDQPKPYVCMGDPIEIVVSDWAATGKVVYVKVVWRR